MKKHWMASLVVLLSCCFLAACEKGDADGWKEYKYRDDGFAISAPLRPVPMPDPSATPAERKNNRLYGIDFGNRTTIVIGVSPADDFGENVPAEELLQRLKNLTLRGTVSKLVSQKEISLAGNPGIEYEYQAAGFHARERFYVVKDKFLGMQSMAYGGDPLAPATDRIFDSLRLLK